MNDVKSVNGPYTIKTKYKDRNIVIIRFFDGSRKTMSHARWLICKKEKRWLNPDETVDHIDENPLNDNLENLQILSISDNVRRSIKPSRIYTFICPTCGLEAEKLLCKVKHNRKQGKAGPFCGKQCSRQWQIIMAISSSGEQPSDTGKVKGSIPLLPTGK